MKNKKVTLTTLVFVLLTSLIFANGNDDLINKKEFRAEIKSQIQNALPRPDIGGNWLKEDPLGYMSISELGETADKVKAVLKTKKTKYLSNRDQFNMMSYVIDMNDENIFKTIFDMGFSPSVKVNFKNRKANIFTQVVLSKNKAALDYLYLKLPYEILQEEMYYALQSLIRIGNNPQNLSDNWYSMIQNKYANTPATFEDLTKAVLYGKTEGAEELQIAFNSIPQDLKVKELYRTLLSLIYRNNRN